MKKSAFILALILLISTLLVLPAFGVVDESPLNHTPYALTVKQMTVDGTHPYGSAELTFKIDNLPTTSSDPSTLTWYVNVDKKIGNADWISVENIPAATFAQNNKISSNPDTYRYEQIWIESYEWTGSTPISFRVYVMLDDIIGNRGGKSAYSNTAVLGLQGSPWALGELEEAEALGLIPESLKGIDLTRPINREEFCELAVLLYEKTTLTTATAHAPNPFTDTSNPQILKAFKLQITNGTSPTTFEPKKLITREQCAAMLFRTIKAIHPSADYSIAGIKDFPDQASITAYAVDAAKYMSRLGIIKGDANGYFMPRATTQAQIAQGYGMATREAAILMSVRSYNKIK